MNFEAITSLARRTLRKSGFDLLRFRSLNTVLKHHAINVVLDVGANEGQYGLELRSLGYRGKIVSFEPQKAPFAILAETARRDGNWTAVNIGLGRGDTRQEINVYGDSRLSSLLTVDEGNNIFGTTRVGTESIEIRTLDGILDSHVAAGDRILLKIDTQGFEKQVLAGAEQSLPRLTGVQLELSVTPLYSEQPRLEEMITLMRSKGYMLWQMQRGACVMATGQEMEVDGVFIRLEASRPGL